MKKKISLLLASTLLMLCLAACGEGPAPAPASEAALPESAAAAPEEAETAAPESAPEAEAPAPEESETAEPEETEEAEAETAGSEPPEAEIAPETPEIVPSREDMRGHGKIAVPKDESWLPSYGTRYVCSHGGVAAFLYTAPVTASTQFDNVIEGTELTLLAKENEFYLVKTPDGRVGWVGEAQTAEDTHLLDSVPSLDGSFWIYHKGPGDENSYAVQFSANRRVAGVRLSDGKRFATDWTLSMRRVKFDGIYFAWDGEQFLSRDEFSTPEGKMHYSIVPDAERLYEQLTG